MGVFFALGWWVGWVHRGVCDHRSDNDKAYMMRYGSAYLTNLTTDITVKLNAGDHNKYESMVLWVTNSSSTPHSVIIANQKFWCTNGENIQIVAQHYGR